MLTQLRRNTSEDACICGALPRNSPFPGADDAICLIWSGESPRDRLMRYSFFISARRREKAISTALRLRQRAGDWIKSLLLRQWHQLSGPLVLRTEWQRAQTALLISVTNGFACRRLLYADIVELVLSRRAYMKAHNGARNKRFRDWLKCGCYPKVG